MFVAKLAAESPLRGRIAVMDSGAGGLTVLAELLRVLPKAPVVYFGDSAFAPYGEKEIGEVQSRVLQIGEHLLDGGVLALVMACNGTVSCAGRDGTGYGDADDDLTR